MMIEFKVYAESEIFLNSKVDMWGAVDKWF